MRIKPVHLVCIGTLACALTLPVHAVPPPPERPPHSVSLPDSRCAILIEDEVRAYDFVSVRFSGRAGDVLTASLAGDPGQHLQLQLRAPSGIATDVQRDAEGFFDHIQLPEDGGYQLVVAMDGEQARLGRAIRFVLALSRRTR